MPKAYESMRDKFAKGAPKDSPAYDAAQSKAARIYNAKHKGKPVVGKKKKAKKRKAVGSGGIARDIFASDSDSDYA